MMLFANAMWQSPARVSDLPALFEQMAEASLAEAALIECEHRARDAKVLSFPVKYSAKAGSYA